MNRVLLPFAAAVTVVSLWAGCSTSGTGPGGIPTATPAPAGALSTTTPGATAASKSPSPSVTGTPVSITLDCWNVSGCYVCGSAAYDCSNLSTWSPDCSFTDPCAAGQIPRQIAVRIYGAGCSSGPSFATDVNGTALGATATSQYCFCGMCVSWPEESAYYAAGFPAYVSGGMNTFHVTGISGTICIAWVDLTLGCQ
jgi:hypothetical protein